MGRDRERQGRGEASARVANGRDRTARRGWIGDHAARRAGGTRLIPTGARKPALSGGSLPPTLGKARGAPCWLSLASRDIRAAEEFYSRVLGWCHVPLLGSPRRPRSLALQAGRPVGTLSETASDLGVYAGWMPYFAVEDVDVTVARLHERGATVAVGPLATGAGRVVVAAGPDDAVFGLREQAPDEHWTVGEGPVARLELLTRDIFAAALFYGGALNWADSSCDCCEVEYVDGQILVRDGLRTVAALRDGTPPGFEGRHRWHACFRVADADSAAAAAVGWGGRVITPPQGPPHRREAVLADREGIPFTVVAS
ncbi:VOC family protein [Streptomyces venezuelae]|uniref:VOC family protein n=1 Tax=Streptomyces venezuelae TaxID=54571 RepID=UPI00378A2BAF